MASRSAKLCLLAMILAVTVVRDSLQANVNSSCGVPAVKPIINGIARVRGGSEAVKGSWPWQVRIGLRDYSNRPVLFVCGGSIISDNYVLTAGHCILQEYLDAGYTYFVRVGDHRTDSKETHEADYTVQKIKLHPQFSASIHGLKNDVALLKLSKRITYSNTVSPACLPTENADSLSNRTCVVTGWGSTVNQTTGLFRKQDSVAAVPLADPITVASKVLKQAVQSIFAQNACKRCWQPLPIYDHMLCTYREGSSWSATGHGEACQGDSGGPLACKVEGSDNKSNVEGVVSFGVGCGLGGPSVYSRVSKFIDWIKTNTIDV